MPNDARARFLEALNARFGPLKRLSASQSLFEIADGRAIVYVRYSRLHGGDHAFYGLRAQDIANLRGKTAYVAFLWDAQPEPVLLPIAELEAILSETTPAADSQYKAQVLLQNHALELYVARAGRHNIEAYVGWERIEEELLAASSPVPSLTHSQVQTLLGAIGTARGLDVWVPAHDRMTLDWSVSARFECRATLPPAFDKIERVLREIDVVWLRPGSSTLEALYEVEHSTPIYTGLLRFNDVQLNAPSTQHFSIVAEDERRGLFIEQLRRPTFEASGLSAKCGFVTYPEVFRWHRRVSARAPATTAPSETSQ